MAVDDQSTSMIYAAILVVLFTMITMWLKDKDLSPNESNPAWWQVSKNSSFSRLVLPPTFKRVLPKTQPSRFHAVRRMTKRFVPRGGSSVPEVVTTPDMSPADPVKRERRFFSSGQWSFKRQRDATPLLVFVNSRSGARQGQSLKRLFQHYLNPIQVADLSELTGKSGVQDLLQEYMRNLRNLRILCCGGDGTANWILATIDAVRAAADFDAAEYCTDRPPVAVLPLGTGNDLARCIGWGGGYVGGSIRDVLTDVARSYPVFLDRWNVDLPAETPTASCFPSAGAKLRTTFSNYWGIGVDAQATWSFHTLREARPGWFFSRLGNKLWYALLGGRIAMRQECKDLIARIALEADGEAIELPEGSEGIIFLNVKSYAAGVQLWTDPEDERSAASNDDDDDDTDSSDNGEANTLVRIASLEEDLPDTLLSDNDNNNGSGSRPGSPGRRKRESKLTWVNESTMSQASARSSPVAMCVSPAKSRTGGEPHPSALNRGSQQDGLIDIVCIRGIVHLGKVKIGVSEALKIRQAKSVKIRVLKEVPMQFDGEPHMQQPCELTLGRKDQAIMLHKVVTDADRNVAQLEDLLKWSVAKDIITKEQKILILQETSRRMEQQSSTSTKQQPSTRE